MEVAFAEYSNVKRAEMALWLLFAKRNATLVPVCGSFVVGTNAIKCTSDETVVLATNMTGSAPVLVRCVANGYAEGTRSGNVVLHDTVAGGDNFFYQLVELCKSKYDISKNPFSFECASNGCTLLISTGYSSDSVSHTVKAPTGDAVMEEARPIRNLLSDCKSIKSFTFRMTNEQCEKDISVKWGQVEVLREVAHYLNRTLLIYKLSDEGVADTLVCLASNGCCEFRSRRNGGGKFVRLPFNKINVSQFQFVSAADTTIDQITGRNGLQAALGVKQLNA